MNSTLVRAGGIVALALYPAMIVLSIVASKLAPSADPFGSAVFLFVGTVSAAALAFVYWAAGRHFNANGYRKADSVILGVIALIAAGLVFDILVYTTKSAAILPALVSIKVIVGVKLLAMVAAVVLLLAFALKAIGFGRSGGGKIWTAMGVLSLIGLSLFAIGGGIAALKIASILTPAVLADIKALAAFYSSLPTDTFGSEEKIEALLQAKPEILQAMQNVLDAVDSAFGSLMSVLLLALVAILSLLSIGASWICLGIGLLKQPKAPALKGAFA